MKIYVIGSCRVHGPLKPVKGYCRGPVGYTHSTKESIQSIQFVRQEIEIAPELRQYVFGRSQDPWRKPHKEWLDTADVVIVEISTGKINERQGVYLQSNYLARHGDIDGVQAYKQDDLSRDIETLKGMVNNLIVVQHIELPGIPERSAFAAELRQACATHDVPVFIPTGKTIDPYHYDPKALPEIRGEMLRFIREC